MELSNKTDHSVHKPVMLNETISFLNIKPDGVYVDMTIGAGGHSKVIAEKLNENGHLVGIDRDETILNYSRNALKSCKSKCSICHANFSEILSILEKLEIKFIDGVLFDFGVSSYQIDNPERGFSFLHEGPLDMRMNQKDVI